MRLCLFQCINAVLLSCACVQAQSQSLTDQLRREPPDQLAREALEKGDAVRGAVLFPDQKLGCAGCHQAGNDRLLGPDLTRMNEKLSGPAVVEALLYPSRKIRKGFESASVALTSGKVLTGRILVNDADRLVLRDTTPDRRRHDLSRSEIEEVAILKTSTMPEKLVDQMASRQQFLDVVRYVTEISASQSAARQRLPEQTGQMIARELQGIALFQDYNCAACHASNGFTHQVTRNPAPDLAWSVKHVSPEFLVSMIANPDTVKRHGRMPSMLGALAEPERTAVARQITHFLESKFGAPSKPEQVPFDPERVDSGRQLYSTIGCAACHSPRGQNDEDLLPEQSVPLGLPSAKYSHDGLVRFLENPHLVRRGGRMPDMQLSHWEAVDLSHYLRHKPGSLDAGGKEWRMDPQLAEMGRTQFVKFQCHRCHTLPGLESSAPGATHIAELRPERGCLSGRTGDWPRFDFRDGDVVALQGAIVSLGTEISDEDHIGLSLTAFRCLNCHQRNELGGVSELRNPHFTTANPNLGPQGRIPPTLTRVGAKLQPKWLRQVLVSGRSIRPYLNTRMPRFGTENVEHLIDLFEAADRLPQPNYPEMPDDKATRDAGWELAGTTGLNCIACHTFQQKKTATMPAVDLTEMSERLKKSWFHDYMKSPQQFSLNTVMPSFWPGGRAIRPEILNGRADQQIEALWRYLLDGRQARAPRGLIQEPMRLLATNEAVMLRRSYRGVGKRGIGVGYPEQLNLVFDAEQMRLAMLWKGDFADVGGVFRSQGHGTVSPLNQPVPLMAGPDIDDAEQPWIVDEGRPPRHQFRGYSLDEKRRPTFQYRFRDVSVSDYFTDRAGAGSANAVLRRETAIQPGETDRNVVFRLANGRSIRRAADRSFAVDDRLVVRLVSGHQADVLSAGDQQILVVRISVSDGKAIVIADYEVLK